MEIIIGRQGTQKIAITDPTVSRMHCRVIVNGDGTYTLENLSQFGTIVDGVRVEKATIGPYSHIRMGNFSATLGDLLGVTPNSQRTLRAWDTPYFSNVGSAKDNRLSESGQSSVLSNQPSKLEPLTFNISYLRWIWEDYNKTNLEFAEKQRKINLIRGGLGIFTMCAMPMIYFFGAVGYALTGVGVLGNLYSFIGMRNSESAVERQKRQDEFDDAWVCPNPACGHTLPARNYRLLVRNHKSCPYCKCKYVER